MRPRKSCQEKIFSNFAYTGTTKACEGKLVRKCPGKAQKAIIPGILNTQEIRSEFNSKMLNFSIVLRVTKHV